MFVIFLDFLFQKFVSFTFFYLKKEIRNSDTHIQGERVRDEERERQEREREILPPNSLLTRQHQSGIGQNQEPRIPSGPLTWMVGTQELGPSYDAFLSTLARR